MKKKIFIIIFLLLCYVNVYAIPEKDGSLLSIDEIILYENGTQTINTIEGIVYNIETNSLLINEDYSINGNHGFIIKNMGEDFSIEVNNYLKVRIEDLSDAFKITNTKVTINMKESKTLIASSNNNGISLINSTLTLETGTYTLDSIKLDKQSKLIKKNTSTINIDSIILDDHELEIKSTSGKFTVDNKTISVGQNKEYKINNDVFDESIQKSKPIIIATILVGLTLIIILIIIKVLNPKTKHYEPKR